MNTTEKALELCYAIERAGASPELTKCTVLANELHDDLKKREDAMELLAIWKKWADIGIEDYLPEWAKPALDETYERTKDLLNSKAIEARL